jgi:hypothetical protein
VEHGGNVLRKGEENLGIFRGSCSAEYRETVLRRGEGNLGMFRGSLSAEYWGTVLRRVKGQEKSWDVLRMPFRKIQRKCSEILLESIQCIPFSLSPFPFLPLPCKFPQKCGYP